MKITVVYVYPSVNSRLYYSHAQRFASTYKQFPPGHEHKLYIAHNGGPHYPSEMLPFEGIPHEDFVRSNLGWDIGAFQEAADNIPCDLLVCLGAPVHFHKPGWLVRMVDAFVENGPHLFGCVGYLYPNPHIRTTAFWCPPQIIQSYPYHVGSTRQSRYEFEHGSRSLTRHVMIAGLETIMVTWRGIYPFDQWKDNIPGVDDILVHDQHIFRR